MLCCRYTARASFQFFHSRYCAFIALTPFVGHQEGHSSFKNLTTADPKGFLQETCGGIRHMVIGDHEKMSVKQNLCAYMCIHVISYIPLRILFIHCIVVLTVFRYLGQFKHFDRSIDCGYDQPVIKFIVANCEHCLRLWIIG